MRVIWSLRSPVRELSLDWNRWLFGISWQREPIGYWCINIGPLALLRMDYWDTYVPRTGPEPVWIAGLTADWSAKDICE